MHEDKESFEALQKRRNRGIFLEFLAFVGNNKKYWLIPLFIILIFVGAILILSGSSLAPFIYPLF